MDAAKRAQGGANNQRGNRYEDMFAVFKLAEYAPRVLDQGEDVRLKSQARCPVDDLLIEAADASHFHQLKARKSVAWSQDDGKLKREFLAQQAACAEFSHRPFKLWLVVSDSGRAALLEGALPAELASCTKVIHFPEAARLSDLIELHPPAAAAFEAIFGGGTASQDDLKAIAKLLYGCWMDASLDEDGFKQARPLLEGAIQFRSPPIRHRWTPPDDRWKRAEAVLDKIEGFRCSVSSRDTSIGASARRIPACFPTPAARRGSHGFWTES